MWLHCTQRKPLSKVRTWRNWYLGPVHTYPEIFVSANFFMRIQKYLRPHVAYTNRIRPSTRIRFVSGHLKGLVNRACALRQRIQKYTDTSVHTYPDTQRIQKFPLWRAYTEISGYTERIRRTRVDARCIRIKKNLRIQKSPDTCGRGLTMIWEKVCVTSRRKK